MQTKIRKIAGRRGQSGSHRCLRWIFLAVALIFSGCAHQISAPHEPGVQELDSEQALDISLELHSDVGDREGAMIGNVSNMPGGGVVLEPAHDEWLTDGLTREFERAGFWVYEDQDSSRPHVTVRHLEFAGEVVNRSSLGEKGAAVAAFDIEVTIPDQGVTFQRQFATSASEESRRSVDSEDLERLLREVLADVYTDIVTETHRLLVHGPR